MCNYNSCGLHCVREPVLRRMPDGSLLCFSLAGGPREPHNDNYVSVIRSEDDGAHWSLPRMLFWHSMRACWGTEIFIEGNRPIAFVQTYNAECHYRELQTFVSYGDASGEQWTEPISLPNSEEGPVNGVSVRKGIVMSNGKWLFPIYWQEVHAGFDWQWASHVQNVFYSGVMLSDNGTSFIRRGCIQGGWEPSCVELDPGHLVMLMRSCETNFLQRTDSYDFGRTWGIPIQTDISNPKTKPVLLKIGKNVILINNYSSSGNPAGRTHLQLRISNDEMRSWRIAVILEEATETWFYPDAFADMKKKQLYVVYENMVEHRLVKLTFAELGI